MIALKGLFFFPEKKKTLCLFGVGRVVKKKKTKLGTKRKINRHRWDLNP